MQTAHKAHSPPSHVFLPRLPPRHQGMWSNSSGSLCILAKAFLMASSSFSMRAKHVRQQKQMIRA